MKRPGKKALGLIATAVLALPGLWLLILVFLPMDWARTLLIASIKDSTQQDVRIAKVRLRPFGGIAVSGLEIAAPATSQDPWLKALSLIVDLRAGDLLRGRISPTDCRISGLSLRVRRDETGRLEFEDLLKPKRLKDSGSPSSETGATPAEISFQVENATILVDDQATDTRLEFTEVVALGTDDGVVSNLSEMTGQLNGGSFTITGHSERSKETTIEGQIRSRDIALGVGTKAISYFVPIIAGSPQGPHANGTLTFELDLRTQGQTSASLVNALTGRGSVAVDGLTIDDSQVMAEVSKLLPIPTQNKLGSLRGDFQIANRRVTTTNTVLRIAEVPISLTGWSDLDGNLEYLMRCEKLGKTVSNLARKLPPEARELLSELPVDDLGILTNVRISGTLDRLIVEPGEGSVLAKKNATKTPARRAADRAKLRAAGKKFLERVIR